MLMNGKTLLLLHIVGLITMKPTEVERSSYNWYAVNTGKLCPGGWHVPSDAEWTILTDFLGGINVAGGKMKEAGLTHWRSPNASATNESNFSALRRQVTGA